MSNDQAVGANKDEEDEEELDDVEDHDEKITASGGSGKVGDDKVKDDDVSVGKEAVVEGSGGSVHDDSVTNSNTGEEVGNDLAVDSNAGVQDSVSRVQDAPSDDDDAHDVDKPGNCIDPYVFDELDDSMEDPLFEPPKPKKVKKFDAVRIWSKIQATPTSKQTAAVTNQTTRRTQFRQHLLVLLYNPYRH